MFAFVSSFRHPSIVFLIKVKADRERAILVRLSLYRWRQSGFKNLIGFSAVDFYELLSAIQVAG